jgi:hypothetical protein
MKYKAYRIIDGKPRWIVVNEIGNIVNRNPNKDEIKGLDKFLEKDGRGKLHYTDNQLLWYLIQFYKKYGRSPTARDFDNDPYYPNSTTYQKRFRSWSNALKLVGLDVESIVKKGVIETADQKARFSEIIVRDHFERYPVDLAGENKNSPCDGICPNGKIYDVKSSALDGTIYNFHTGNKYGERIEIYYLLGFKNENYRKLNHGWRIPGEIVDRESVHIGIRGRLNIYNMEKYEITDKLRDILTKYGIKLEKNIRKGGIK